jgi:hypothetical protein
MPRVCMQSAILSLAMFDPKVKGRGRAPGKKTTVATAFTKEECDLAQKWLVQLKQQQWKRA